MCSLRTSSWKSSGVVSRFVRKVRAASGAVAVQVVTRRGRQVERVEHVGSAHADAGLALLLAAAGERLSPGTGLPGSGGPAVVPARMGEVADRAGEPELPLRPAAPAAGGRPAGVAAGGRVAGTSADLLWAVLTSAYARLGFEVPGDDGFRAMVLARIAEPASRAGVVRVLDEIGAPVVAACHDLWRAGQSFRMTKGDLRARPVFHHQREAIEAHLTVVLAALAVTRYLQDATGTSIKKIVQALRTARPATIEINGQRLTLDPVRAQLETASG
jgi:hypothetical protein